MIKSKSVKVVEIIGEDELILTRGQRVTDTKIIHQTIPEGSTIAKFPNYKVVVVLECVEYEED